MSSQDDLEALLKGLPTSSLVPVGFVLQHLHPPVEPKPREVGRDLTLPEVAERVRRSVSCVRGWCAAGELVAYKLRGREWRVRSDDLRAFLDAQRQPKQEPKKSRAPDAPADLGAWRKVRARGDAA